MDKFSRNVSSWSCGEMFCAHSFWIYKTKCKRSVAGMTQMQVDL